MSKNNFTTSRQTAYSYIHVTATSPKPTLLLLHGFPSQSEDWQHQIDYFSSLGYGIVAPDLLGFGESSKPEDVQNYRIKLICQDLVELLDSLQLSSVIAVGHDLGANLPAKLAMYFPAKVSAMVFIAVGCSKPGTQFDIDLIHQFTKQALGHEMFGYVSWLGRDDPHLLLEQNAESVMSLMYTKDLNAWDKHFHPIDAMHQFVQSKNTISMGDWYTEDMRKRHLLNFGSRDGYKGATRWYKMMVENTSLPDETGYQETVLSQPTLFIGHSGAEMAMAQQIQMLQAWISNVKIETINSGHWPHLECPQKTNKTIQEFIEQL